MPDFDVEIELVDGHRLTVRREEVEAGWAAAMFAGDWIVRRARAKLVSGSCPKCWNSGIERAGYNEPSPENDAETIERRVICDCEHGRQILANDDPRRYSYDPTKADPKGDGDDIDGVHRVPNPDGSPSDEYETNPEPVLRLRLTFLASSPFGADDPAGGGSVKFELQGKGEGRRGTAALHVTGQEWHALRELASTDAVAVELDEIAYTPSGTRLLGPESLDG